MEVENFLNSIEQQQQPQFFEISQSGMLAAGASAQGGYFVFGNYPPTFGPPAPAPISQSANAAGAYQTYLMPMLDANGMTIWVPTVMPMNTPQLTCPNGGGGFMPICPTATPSNPAGTTSQMLNFPQSLNSLIQQVLPAANSTQISAGDSNTSFDHMLNGFLSRNTPPLNNSSSGVCDLNSPPKMKLVTPSLNNSKQQLPFTHSPFPRHASSASTAAALRINSSVSNRVGYHKNILFKTEMCNDWNETGTCPRLAKCQFAHGKAEMHDPRQHPLYKTAFCKDYEMMGNCPRGDNCFHVHQASEMRRKNRSRYLRPRSAFGSGNQSSEPSLPQKTRADLLDVFEKHQQNKRSTGVNSLLSLKKQE